MPIHILSPNTTTHKGGKLFFYLPFPMPKITHKIHIIFKWCKTFEHIVLRQRILVIGFFWNVEVNMCNPWWSKVYIRLVFGHWLVFDEMHAYYNQISESLTLLIPKSLGLPLITTPFCYRVQDTYVWTLNVMNKNYNLGSKMYKPTIIYVYYKSIIT